MSSLPLVVAEVRRISGAFTTVSHELAAAQSGVRDIDLVRIGTPSADSAVAAGLADLLSALDRLQASADACTAAMRRHGVEDVTADPGESAGTGEDAGR